MDKDFCDAPSLRESPAIAPVAQRLADDCTVCAIAMATDLSYEEVFRVASETKFGYRPGIGTVAPSCVLKALGFEVRAFGGASGKPLAAATGQMLWGRKAIVSLPSLSGFSGHHDLYWDGHRLADPSNGKRYAPDALPDTPIVGVVLFDEACSAPLGNRKDGSSQQTSTGGE